MHDPGYFMNTLGVEQARGDRFGVRAAIDWPALQRRRLTEHPG